MEPSLKDRILAAAAAAPSPARARGRRESIVAALLAATWMVAVFLVALAARRGPQPGDPAPPSFDLRAGTAAGALVIAAGALAICLGRGDSMLGRRRRALWLAIALVPSLLLAWKLGFTAAMDGSAIVPWPHRAGFRCLGLSLSMAAVPLAAFMLRRRDSDPVHPTTTGIAAGVAIGACAWLLIDLWCPVAWPSHLLVGHVLPIAILAACGALVGRRWLAMR